MVAMTSCVAFSATLNPKLFQCFFSTWKSKSPSAPPNDAFRRQKLFFTRNNIFSSSPTASTVAASAASPFEFNLFPPPIDHDLLDTMEDIGAKISEDGFVETFGNDEEAIDAALDDGVAVVDLTHFGRIRGIFFSVAVLNGIISYLLQLPNLMFTNDRYIFFADKVEIHDITKQTCFFVLVGPKSNQVMEDLNLGILVGQPYGTHHHYSVSGTPITIGVGSLVSEEGFSLLLSPAAAGPVWKTLLSLGAIPMGTNAWERFRILQGRPAPGKELTNEFNVLEARLLNAVSLNKGCYKGQETISRLITYDGVKQKLWGVHLSGPAEPGSPITVDGKKVGKLTSYATGRKELGHFGLGYLKRQAASLGDEVDVGGIVGKVVELPFLSRQSLLTGTSTT